MNLPAGQHLFGGFLCAVYFRNMRWVFFLASGRGWFPFISPYAKGGTGGKSFRPAAPPDARFSYFLIDIAFFAW